jgi:phasin
MRVMTEATATQAASAKPARSPFDLSKFEMAKMEVPAEFRALTDTGLAHARNTYAKAKVASEEAADLFQDTFATVATGATNYNLKVIGIARTNTCAAFDCALELLSAKSPTEIIELSTAHARRQFDIVSGQNKELWALAQKVATEVAEPIKTGMSKAFNEAA